jgi:hypothetical protein
MKIASERVNQVTELLSHPVTLQNELIHYLKIDVR